MVWKIKQQRQQEEQKRKEKQKQEDWHKILFLIGSVTTITAIPLVLNFDSAALVIFTISSFLATSLDSRLSKDIAKVIFFISIWSLFFIMLIYLFAYPKLKEVHDDYIRNYILNNPELCTQQ